MAQPITVVDAFTDTAFSGNPAAVCVLTEERDKRWMQLVAREMNHAETAFLLRRADAWALRWFTPTVEVDLCGHATLASAHVLWETGGIGRDETARFHTLSRWTAAVLYLQILLGAHVRHSGAGLACGAQWLDALLCQGQWIPSLQELPMVQFTHRLLALIVAGLIMSVAAQARRAQLPYALVRQARGAAALVVLQIAFGVMSVTSLLSAHWTTLHLVTAALMLALLVGLVAQSRPSVLIEGSAAQSREVAAS